MIDYLRRSNTSFLFLGFDSFQQTIFTVYSNKDDVRKMMIFRLPLKGAGGKKPKNQHQKIIGKAFNSFLLIALLLIIILSEANAQDTGFPDTWGRWKTRIVLTAENLGPNALPVPEIRNGFINPNAYLSLSGNYQFSDFDKTYNPHFKVSLPIADGKVSIEVWSPFYEYFVNDTLSLIERKAREISPTGKSGGDIYIATLIQVLKNHEYLPDMLISINLKTASGNNLEMLRHTDTPGYYFDLSLGKSFLLSEKYSLRPFGLIGFYVYQTHQVMGLQNDALLWGGGLSFFSPRVEFTGSLGGYHGYFNQGDRPVVVRISSSIKLINNFFCTINFQNGINDFPYKSIGVGIKTQIY